MNPAGRETPEQFATLILAAFTCGMALVLPVEAADEPSRAVVIATPDGGIERQVVADENGILHLIYFKGDPAGGDLFYARSKPGTIDFSKPIRVNSQPGSAVAIGTIRGGQLALGRGGLVHVAWNGSQRAAPPNPIKGTPMLYTRLDRDQRAFEPQRNLMHGLSTSMAAAQSAPTERETSTLSGTRLAPMRRKARQAAGSGLPDRATMVRLSPKRSPHSKVRRGVCLLRYQGLVDRRGTLHVLYRAATQCRARHDAGHVERRRSVLQGSVIATLAGQHLPDELGVAVRHTHRSSCGMGDKRADRLLPNRSAIAHRNSAGLASGRWQSKAPRLPQTPAAKRSWCGRRTPAGSAAALWYGGFSIHPAEPPARWAV